MIKKDLEANPSEQDGSAENKKLFIPKSDGLGWTLNFGNKWSYPVLIIIIAMVIVGLYFALTQKS
jgi:uncharacterized membrane protein